MTAATKPEPSTKPEHTYQTTAPEVGMSVKTLQQRTARGLYPHSRNGRRVLFSDADIEAIKAIIHHAPAEPEAADLRPYQRRRSA